jgi:hypothetical protein
LLRPVAPGKRKGGRLRQRTEFALERGRDRPAGVRAAGVRAVRAGPPLAETLRRKGLGHPRRVWRPERAAPAILGVGRRRALAWRRKGFAASGRAAARWKAWLDRRWIAMCRPGPWPVRAGDRDRSNNCDP